MIETKGWTIEGVYHLALNKQYIGAVFHRDAFRLMEYLYFPVLAKLQEKQYKDEMKNVTRIEQKYLYRYHKVLAPRMNDRVEVIAPVIFSTSSCEVTNADRKKQVYDFFNKWSSWEEEVEKYYTVMSDWFTQNELGGDACLFSSLASEVAGERERIFKIIGQLKIHDWSPDYVDRVAKCFI